MDISELKRFFARYAAGFMTGNADTDKHLRLKRFHTFRVLDNARKIMTAEKFSPAEFSAGEKAALLHDLSRFEQYSQYRTFRDTESFDHGMRSAELIRSFGLVDGDPAAEDIIFAVVRHNQMEVGEAPGELARKIAEAVRDADKLDIFRVIFSFKNDPKVSFSLNNEKTVTPEILASLREGRCADHREMRSAVDFFAAKIRWFYELNFPESFRIAARRRFLPKLAALLEGVPELPPLFAEAANHLKKECKKQ